MSLRKWANCPDGHVSEVRTPRSYLMGGNCIQCGRELVLGTKPSNGPRTIHLPEPNDYWDGLCDILEKQFPKGKAKERGQALVLMAHVKMALDEKDREIARLKVTRSK